MGSLEYFSVLGRALFPAQHFEMNCRALAGYLNMRVEIGRKSPAVLETPEFRDRSAKLWKQTLGCYIHYFQDMNIVSNDIAQILDDARNARNEIAHWVAVGTVDVLDSEPDIRIAEIRTHVKKIAVADKYIAVLILAKNNDPFPNRQFFDEYEKKVADWVCESAFDQ